MILLNDSNNHIWRFISLIQGLSPSQNLHSLSPPLLHSLDQHQQHLNQHHNNCNNSMPSIGYGGSTTGLPLMGRFCTSSPSSLANLTAANNCNVMASSGGSGLLRAALAQGSNSSSHSPSPPEHIRLESETTPTPTPSQVMSHLMGVLNNNGVVSGLMPNDLDLNLDSLQGGFEDCNVDEVIKHELSMDGSLDFNFSQHQQLMQQQQQQHHQQYQSSLQQQHHHHYLQQHYLNQKPNPTANSGEFNNLGHFGSSSNSVPTPGGQLSSTVVSSQPTPVCSLAALASGRSWVR